MPCITGRGKQGKAKYRAYKSSQGTFEPGSSGAPVRNPDVLGLASRCQDIAREWHLNRRLGRKAGSDWTLQPEYIKNQSAAIIISSEILLTVYTIVYRVRGGLAVVCWTANERSEAQTLTRAEIWIEISAPCSPYSASGATSWVD